MFCPNCKKQNEDAAKVCWNCKTLLESAELAPPEPKPPAPPPPAPAPPAPAPQPLPSPPRIHVALLEQFERLLGRRPEGTEQAPQLATELKERIDVLQSAGTLP